MYIVLSVAIPNVEMDKFVKRVYSNHDKDEEFTMNEFITRLWLQDLNGIASRPSELKLLAFQSELCLAHQ